MSEGKAQKSYFGRPVRCPYPDCSHSGLLITKVHCRMHHNMEREEVFALYGEPKTLVYDPQKLKALSQHKRAESQNYNDNLPASKRQQKAQRKDEYKKGYR